VPGCYVRPMDLSSPADCEAVLAWVREQIEQAERQGHPNPFVGPFIMPPMICMPQAPVRREHP